MLCLMEMLDESILFSCTYGKETNHSMIRMTILMEVMNNYELVTVSLFLLKVDVMRNLNNNEVSMKITSMKILSNLLEPARMVHHHETQ